MRAIELKQLIKKAIREGEDSMDKLIPKTHFSSPTFSWGAYADWSRREGEVMALRAVLSALEGYPLMLINMGKKGKRL